MDKRDKKEMNRREFLKIVGVSTVASTVAMYGCASGEKSNASEASILGEVPVDKMTYRTSPKGEHVSLLVGSINSIFYFLHKAAEPFNCLEQDNLA